MRAANPKDARPKKFWQRWSAIANSSKVLAGKEMRAANRRAFGARRAADTRECPMRNMPWHSLRGVWLEALRKSRHRRIMNPTSRTNFLRSRSNEVFPHHPHNRRAGRRNQAYRIHQDLKPVMGRGEMLS